jgi:hypothetical protein
MVRSRRTDARTNYRAQRLRLRHLSETPRTRQNSTYLASEHAQPGVALEKFPLRRVYADRPRRTIYCPNQKAKDVSDSLA